MALSQSIRSLARMVPSSTIAIDPPGRRPRSSGQTQIGTMSTLPTLFSASVTVDWARYRRGAHHVGSAAGADACASDDDADYGRRLFQYGFGRDGDGPRQCCLPALMRLSQIGIELASQPARDFEKTFAR